MTDTFKGIITADGKKRQLPYGAVLKTPISDETLSIQGAFADAKVVGDNFKKTKVETDSLKEDIAAETSRATAVENTKADKTALARTDRSLDALWKLNSGVSYEFQTDDTEAYQKTVPTGAKMANVKSIGGKTIVWNQLVNQKDSNETNYGVDIARTSTGNISMHGTVTESMPYNQLCLISNSIMFKRDGSTKYLVKINKNINKKIGVSGYSADSYKSFIFSSADGGMWDGYIYVHAAIGDEFDVDDLSICVFDLTQMFGAGNEPTIEEFEAMFPSDYYPHNAGELMSAPVNEVTEQGKNLLNIEKFLNDSFAEYSKSGETYSINMVQNLFSYPFTIAKEDVDISLSVNSFENISSINPRLQLVNKTGELVSEISAGNSIKKVNGKACKFRFDWSSNSGKISLSEIMIELGSVPTAYEPYHSTTHAIPQSILELDGYGDGVTADVYNYIDWESKKYYKRVGKVDLGTVNYYKDGITYRTSITDMKIVSKDTAFNGLCTKFIPISFSSDWSTTGTASQDGDNRLVLIEASIESIESFKQAMSGVMLYYELAEEQITDISDLIGDTLQEPIEVEAGGSLTFRNAHGANYRVPVPNSVEYTVKLSEVAK